MHGRTKTTGGGNPEISCSLALAITLSSVVYVLLAMPPCFAQGELANPSQPIRVSVFDLDPLNFVDDAGEAQGLYPDLIRALLGHRGVKIEFVPGTWAEGLARVEQGDVDLQPIIAWSEERAKVLDYSEEPVVTIWGQVFTRPDELVTTVLELEGSRVGIMGRDINGANFISTAEKFGVSCEIVEFGTHADLFLAVQRGEIRAGVAPQHYGFGHADDYDLVGSSIIFSPFPIFFATKKGGRTDLLRHIDEHLREWKADKNSGYYRIVAYWMGGKSFERKIIPQWLVAVLLGTGVTALLLLLNVRLLRVQVRRRTEELHASEQHYRELVDSVNSIILRMNRDGTIAYMNDYGLKFFGFREDELIGRSVLGTIVPEKTRDGFDLSAMLQGLVTNPGRYELNENENIRQDGRIVIVQWTNKAIYDAQGVFKELFSVGTDMTERRKWESHLQQEQKIEAIGVLAGGIAHDFNNILAVIIGNADLAHPLAKNDTELQEYLDEISHASHRARKLIQQILTFSRSKEQTKRTVSLTDALSESRRFLRATIPTTVDLQLKIEKDALVFGNPTQIHQIIMNLCTNAYHALTGNTGAIVLALKTEELKQEKQTLCGEVPPGGYAVIEVKDDGCGMTPALLQKIFEPYFTTKALDEGTGLGLAVVHGILKDMGGTIEVDSEQDKGTTFSVYLPLEKDQRATPRKKSLNGGARGKNEHLLLVDDEEALCALMGKFLRRSGYLVDTFTNGPDLLEALKEQPEKYSLIITDMAMPGMSGIQLVEQVRKLHLELPVVLCSGYVDVIENDMIGELGIGAVLQKPVPFSGLLLQIRKTLDAT
jgi:two-component system, cell cycle sensor histidine kinase and response regulator CckA